MKNDQKKEQREKLQRVLELIYLLFVSLVTIEY